MVQVVEKALDVGLDEVPIPTVLQVEGQVTDRLLRTTLGPVSITEVQEILLIDRTQQLGTSPLDKFVLQRWEA